MPNVFQSSIWHNFVRSWFTLPARRRHSAKSTYIEGLELRTLPANLAPSIVADQSFSIQASSPDGTLVGTVQATDPDAGQHLAFQITSGNNGAFTIEATTGKITIADRKALDSQITPAILTVRVADDGTPALTATATIQISVNHIPTFKSDTYQFAAVDPNQPIGKIAATDSDPNQKLTYSILTGNQDGAFAINSQTGVISVADKNAFNNLAFPKLLTVSVLDSGDPQGADTATVTITRDGSPVPDGQISFKLSDATRTYQAGQNAPPIRLDPKAVFSVGFNVNTDFSKATLAVTLAKGKSLRPSGKLLVVSDEPGEGRVSVVGKSILFDRTVVGHIDNQAGRHRLQITFNESIKAESIQAIIRRIGFKAAGAVGSHQVNLEFSGLPELPVAQRTQSKTVNVVK